MQRACPGAAGFQDLRGARGPDKDHSYWVPTLDQTKDIRKKRGKWIHPMWTVGTCLKIRIMVSLLKSFFYIYIFFLRICSGSALLALQASLQLMPSLS